MGNPSTFTTMLLELPEPKSPVAFMVTTYDSLVGISFSLRSAPSSSKEPESPPVAMLYMAFCPSRNGFCADMLPTIPGASS